MKSTVTTTERKFEYEFDEQEAHVLYALLNMSDDKIDTWVGQQDIYEDWATQEEAVETAKMIRDTVQGDVLKQ